MKLSAILATALFTGLAGMVYSSRAAETNALEFVQPELDLGTVTNGQIVSVSFVMTNHSNKAVKIVNVSTSCHCTVVEKSPDEIAAHGSGAVESSFNPSRDYGSVSQSVIVEAANGQVFSAEFSADIVPSAATAPQAPDGGSATNSNGSFRAHPD
jgi:hypothetical protein